MSSEFENTHLSFNVDPAAREAWRSQLLATTGEHIRIASETINRQHTTPLGSTLVSSNIVRAYALDHRPDMLEAERYLGALLAKVEAEPASTGSVMVKYRDAFNILAVMAEETEQASPQMIADQFDKNFGVSLGGLIFGALRYQAGNSAARQRGLNALENNQDGIHQLAIAQYEDQFDVEPEDILQRIREHYLFANSASIHSDIALFSLGLRASYSSPEIKDFVLENWQKIATELDGGRDGEQAGPSSHYLDLFIRSCELVQFWRGDVPDEMEEELLSIVGRLPEDDPEAIYRKASFYNRTAQLSPEASTQITRLLGKLPQDDVSRRVWLQSMLVSAYATTLDLGAATAVYDEDLGPLMEKHKASVAQNARSGALVALVSTGAGQRYIDEYVGLLSNAGLSNLRLSQLPELTKILIQRGDYAQALFVGKTIEQPVGRVKYLGALAASLRDKPHMMLFE
jgi:hypothetical protein